MPEGPGGGIVEYGNPFCFCAAEPELGGYRPATGAIGWQIVQRDHLARLTILALSRLALSQQLEGDRLHNAPSRRLDALALHR